MRRQYSDDEERAQLFGLIWQLHELGHTFVFAAHSAPSAKLHPHEASTLPRQTLAARILEFEASGQITRSNRKPGEKLNFPRGTRVPGALQRFFEDRN